MPHSSSLIATIVVGLVLAFGCGFVARRLHLPPLVGYLLAGIAVGPFTPGFVADISLAGQRSLRLASSCSCLGSVCTFRSRICSRSTR
jgi:predicted Kef-type K+ transport protein